MRNSKPEKNTYLIPPSPELNLKESYYIMLLTVEVKVELWEANETEAAPVNWEAYEIVYQYGKNKRQYSRPYFNV